MDTFHSKLQIVVGFLSDSTANTNPFEFFWRMYSRNINHKTLDSCIYLVQFCDLPKISGEIQQKKKEKRDNQY